MKNKEKFMNDIVNIACDGKSLAVNAVDYNPVPCSELPCYRCLFYESEETSCGGAIHEWSEREYKEPIVISYNDILFLHFIKDDYNYIVRDKNGDLFAYVSIPEKAQDRGIWIGTSGVGLYKFNIVFPMIKWSDEQPCKISDLKKLKKVINY